MKGRDPKPKRNPMMKRDTAFKLLLALVGISHLVLGLVANLAPPEMLANVVAEFYGANIEVTTQSHHVIRIVGAFMIGVAVMAFLAVAIRNAIRL
jgi:hypothetical protein